MKCFVKETLCKMFPCLISPCQNRIAIGTSSVMPLTNPFHFVHFIWAFHVQHISDPFLVLIAEPKMPEGSWKCEKCNNINYPFRTKCNRQNCGAEKPSESHSPEPSSNEDDQVRCCKYVYLSLIFTLCDNSYRKYSLVFSYKKSIFVEQYILLTSCFTISCIR